MLLFLVSSLEYLILQLFNFELPVAAVSHFNIYFLSSSSIHTDIHYFGKFCEISLTFFLRIEAN